MHTRRALAVAILTALLLPLASAKDQQGFEGKWVIDKKASNGADVPDGFTQQIKQKGNGMTVESRWMEPRDGMAPLILVGLMITRLELNTAGAEQQNQIGPFQQASKTTIDGNRMVTDWRAVVNGEDVTGQWVRTLSPDGKRMTLEIHETSKGQNKDAHLEFVRR